MCTIMYTNNPINYFLILVKMSFVLVLSIVKLLKFNPNDVCARELSK